MTRYHYHDYYEIYYLLSGNRYYYVENKRYTLHKGDIIFIDTFEIHKSVDAGIPDHERICLYFHPSFLQHFHAAERQWLLSPFQSPHKKWQLSISEQSEVERLLFGMHQAFNRPEDVGHRVTFHALLLQLLLLIARKQQGDLTESQEDNSMNARLTEIIAYCNVHYRDELRLDALAERFRMSSCYLSRMFKRTTGFTFKEYVNTLRIREAEKQLRDSQMRILDISEQIGFSNVSHFNRKFKQITNMSPREYRKMTGRTPSL